MAELRGTQEQVAYRHGVRYVPRLKQASALPKPLPQPKGSSPYKLVKSQEGLLEGLRLQPTTLTLEQGQVELAIKAAGLNFRDVLNAMNLHPGDAGPLGSDCAGIITRLGTAWRAIK